jgi:hypothetical protein
MYTRLKTIVLLCLVVLPWSAAKAQQNPAPKYLAAYVELGGNGAILSANGEIFLNRAVSVRAGIGTVLFGVTFPVMVNFLTGKKHHFEIGAGIVHATGEFISDFESTILTGNIGYRYQPVEGRWIFRAGFTPLFNPDTDKFLPWLGISGGIAF